jgi:hypothetical protein
MKCLIGVGVLSWMVSSLSMAQQTSAPPEPPPLPPAPVVVSPPPPPPPPVVLPPTGEPGSAPARAFPLQEPLSSGSGGHSRYSAFSAGPGGLFLLFSNMAFGILLGALVGAYANSNAADDIAPLTALAGAVLLGAAAAGYQYAVWANVPRAATGLLTLGTGLMLGFGILDFAGMLSPPTSTGMLILSAITEVSFFLFLGVTHEAEMTGGDAFCTGMGAVYGFLIALLVLGYANSTSGGVNWDGLLIGPAIGEVLGGVLASLTRPTARTVALAGLIPLAVTGGYMLILSFTLSSPYYWGAAMGVLVLSSIVTGIFTSGITRPAANAASSGAAQGFEILPSFTLIPDTIHGQGVIPGIGFVGRF